MAQHKCGTCLHFEEGGLAGTGWCRHPQRQDIQNVVLVRRNELACRDGWSGDLWEARVGDKISATRLRPAHSEQSNGNGAAIATAVVANQHTDQVKAVTMSPPRPAGVARPLPTFGAVGVASSTNGAGDQIQRPLAAEAQRGPTEDVSGFDRAAAPMVPRPPTGGLASNRVGTAPSRTSPLRGDQSLPRLVPERSAEFDFDASSHRFGARPFSWPAGANAAPNGRSGETEPFPLTRPRASDTAPSAPPKSAPGPMAEPRRHETVVPEPAPSFGARQAKAAPGTAPVETPSILETPAVEAPAPRRHGPISDRIAQMQRCCRTCRDFRPVEGGDRGWCSNPYAFDDRRQVGSEGLACQSTIGDWWTAADDWWLQQADITQHGRPTPNVNELLKQLLARRSGRQT